MKVKPFKPNVKYIVRPAGDGGYNVIEVDVNKKINDPKRFDIYSYHDSMEEAIGKKEELESPASQLDIMRMTKI